MMAEIKLFSNISEEDRERMLICLGAVRKTYLSGEIITEYGTSMQKIGLVLSGQAYLYCSDLEGMEYIEAELRCNSVFGEPFLLPDGSQHYYVRAKEETSVLFIDYEHVVKRCPRACAYHSQMISNLFQMIAQKAKQQSSRIYVLSRTTIRKKIMAYLNCLMAKTGKQTVSIPMSYTELALYLNVDRSALMREFGNLCRENQIEKTGRVIRIL